MLFHRFMLSRFFAIALWTLLAASSPLWAQPGYDDFPVERFTREQGYNPDVEPWCFLQDKKGVMWIGTSDGLYRYDGTFHRYAHEAGTPFSLPKNRVIALYEDKNGLLWVAVKNFGLVRFDRERERFTQYSAHASDSSSLPVADIYSMLEDIRGRFWLAVDSAIVRFDRHSGKVIRRYPLRVSSVQSLALDGSGRLWCAASERFLYRYDEGSDSFTRAPFELPFSVTTLAGAGDTLWMKEINKKGVYAVNVRDGRVVGEFLKEENFNAQYLHYAAPYRVWVCGRDLGGSAALFSVNPRTGEVRPYGIRQGLNQMNPSSLGNMIHQVYEDRSGIVWLIDEGAVSNARTDLGKHAPYKQRFKIYKHNPLDSGSLSGNYARTLLADKNNHLWVIIQRLVLEGGVLNMIDRASGKVRRFYPNPRKAGGLTEGIGALYQDKKGILWVGSTSLQTFDLERPSLGFRTFAPPPKSINFPNDSLILHLNGDRAGNIWVGTQRAGLWRIPANPEKAQKYLPLRDPRTEIPYPFKNIHAILEDRFGALWIASLNGIARYDTASKTLRRYISEAGNPLTIGDNFVTSILETRSGDLWVTTKGGGIARYDRERDVFRKMTTDNGLPHDNCYAILEDGAGQLWISTDNGLCSYNPKTGAIRRYDTEDGLQGNEFNRFSYYQSPSGEMFFGGTNGVNSFFPDLLRDNPTAPLAAIMNVRDIGGDTTYSVAYRSEIELTYRQNNLSVEAAALEFTRPDRNLYSWYLEDVDTAWTEAKRERRITYTNLSPGEYRLRVKVANADGVWNAAPATLVIRIRPAWWQTWWLRGLVVLTVFGVGHVVYRLRIRRVETRNRELERQVGERTKELREANAGLQEAHTEITRQIEVQSEQAREIELANMALQEAHAESEALLLNILPAPIAARLKSGERTIAERFKSVTVLFADVVGFTPLASRTTPEGLVSLLDALFSRFDGLAERYGLEKIKTIGDAYMVVGGLPIPADDHLERVARFALALSAEVRDTADEFEVTGLTMRIGMHTGEVVAGVIGHKKFAYDLWGDTVNTASRMESQGEPGKIHCTEEVYEALKNEFVFEECGEIEIKGKGTMRTWFLVGVLP